MTAAEGTCGGVAILTAKQLGQKPPSFLASSISTPGRAVVRHLQGIIPGGLVVATVYLPLRREKEQRKEAEDILHKLGRKLASHGRPFIITGDWNMAPQVLEQSGLPRRL